EANHAPGRTADVQRRGRPPRNSATSLLRHRPGVRASGRPERHHHRARSRCRARAGHGSGHTGRHRHARGVRPPDRRQRARACTGPGNRMKVPLPITDALEAIARALDGGPAVVVVTNVGGAGSPGERLLLDADGNVSGTLGDAALDARAAELAAALLARGGVAYEPVSAASGEAQLFFEAHRAPERLIVVGAGHISVPLAMIGVELGFRVLVLDDRE